MSHGFMYPETKAQSSVWKMPNSPKPKKSSIDLKQNQGNDHNSPFSFITRGLFMIMLQQVKQ